MKLLLVLKNKVIITLLFGFVFGAAVLIFTSINYAEDCGETMAGFGCAMMEAQLEMFNRIVTISITLLLMMIFFKLLKFNHVVVFSVLGASSTISILSLFSKSYIFYNSIVGFVFYGLLSSALFYISYSLCNNYFYKSKK